MISQLPIFLIKALFLFWPPFLFTGIRLKTIAPDWLYLRVDMSLRFYNRNYIGTHYGGNLYSMIDPWYMMMVNHHLGDAYFVIDHSAHIRYKKPGLARVSAEFILTQAQINAIKLRAYTQETTIETLPVDIKNRAGEVICHVEKSLYIRKRGNGCAS